MQAWLYEICPDPDSLSPSPDPKHGLVRPEVWRRQPEIFMLLIWASLPKDLPFKTAWSLGVLSTRHFYSELRLFGDGSENLKLSKSD